MWKRGAPVCNLVADGRVGSQLKIIHIAVQTSIAVITHKGSSGFEDLSSFGRGEKRESLGTKQQAQKA